MKDAEAKVEKAEAKVEKARAEVKEAWAGVMKAEEEMQGANDGVFEGDLVPWGVWRRPGAMGCVFPLLDTRQDRERPREGGLLPQSWNF